jgi:UDP-glucose 4-epimerase
VIGGAGFVGTQVTRILVRSGRDVLVLGRSARPSRLPQVIAYQQGDYGDTHILKLVLAEADEVIDLAYATAPQTSFADPVFDIVSNLPATVSLLQEAVSAGVSKVILVSSGGTVYGVPQMLPISEDHPTKPISPYGITKLAVENYAWMYRALFDLPAIVVRPANAYGEGQRQLSGQGFVAAAMQRIKQGDDVEVYGAQGTIRDYIHVSDVAAGIVAALEKGQPGTAYNVGTGEGRSNLDVLRMIEPLAAKAGLKVGTRFLPARRFDVPVNILDSARLRAISGWRPAVPLEQGIARLWDAVLAGRGVD